MILSDFHTHTTFSDGANTPEEMVNAALALGMTALGFSDHSEMPPRCCGTSDMSKAAENAYRAEVSRLREKYADRLPIFLGIEQDSISPTAPAGYDYVIGSVHGIRVQGVYRGVDTSEARFLETVREYFGGDFYAYTEAYYRTLAETANKYDPTFFGHFDLVTKYNEGNKYFDEGHPRYRHGALEALHTLLAAGKPFEINTGAISRGARLTPYPAPFLLKEIHDLGGRILLSGDSHSAKSLLCAYDKAAELARACGFTAALTLTNTGWQAEKL